MARTHLRHRVGAFMALLTMPFFHIRNIMAAAPPTIEYHELDQLSGQNITTNNQGQASEVQDYFPFGQSHLDNKSGTFSEQRKFDGQEFDQSTSLLYFGERYENSANGKFLSADPSASAATDDLLRDPQSLNEYSFALNNPIRFLDIDGRAAKDFQRLFPTFAVLGINGLAVTDPTNGLPAYTYATNAPMGYYKGVALVSNGVNQGRGFGSLRAQCVGFVKAFYSRVYGVNIGSVETAANMLNANKLNAAMVDTRADRHFVEFKNGKTTTRPEDDDLIGWSGGAYGHSGVVASVYFDDKTNRGYIDVVEQNWGNGPLDQSAISRHALTRNNSGAYTITDRGSYKVMNWMRLLPKL